MYGRIPSPLYIATRDGVLTRAYQVNRWVNFSALKHYFNVSNSYVVNKLFLVLFPWRHKPWSRKQTVGPTGQEGWYLPPRDDINSPDMYIPGTYLLWDGAGPESLLNSF